MNNQYNPIDNKLNDKKTNRRKFVLTLKDINRIKKAKQLQMNEIIKERSLVPFIYNELSEEM